MGESVIGVRRSQDFNAAAAQGKSRWIAVAAGWRELDEAANSLLKQCEST